jgi:2'-5' RNA ligase
MRYVIVSTIKGEAGDFNNNLRKDVFNKFGAKSSKLPAHFTIKAPFEYDGDISDLENTLEEFSRNEKKSPLKIPGFDHFSDRVVFMKVLMSKEGKEVHDKLIDAMSKISYIDFDKKDGKDKIFHITVSSKRISNVFNDLWEYVNKFPCDFESEFDNVGIYKWENYTWVLHKEYLLK